MVNKDELKAYENTDRKIWSECEGLGERYITANSGGGIGICVGGSVIVKSVEQWHALSSAVEVEPLAELAHKKGFSSISFQRDWECEPLGIKDGIWHYSLYMHQSHLGRKPLSKGFSTYAECEAKARSYLNGLPDAGKEDK